MIGAAVSQPMRLATMEWGGHILSIAGFAFAQAVFGHGDIHDRERVLDARIQGEPQNNEPLIRRGQLFLDANHFNEAVNDFRRTLDLDLNAVGVRYYLGQAYLRSGDVAQAEREARLYIVGTRDQGEEATVQGYRFLGQVLSARSQPLAAAVA